MLGEVDELEPDLFGEGAHEVALLDHAEIDQHPAEGLGRAPMLVERLLELLGVMYPSSIRICPSCFDLRLTVVIEGSGVRSV